jgi:hypothetical protein
LKTGKDRFNLKYIALKQSKNLDPKRGELNSLTKVLRHEQRQAIYDLSRIFKE